MYISIITLIVVGLLNRNTEDSFGSVIEKGGRWNHFEFDPSPYSRFTPFSTFFPGIAIPLLAACSNQGVYQRYTSLSSFRKVKLTIILAGLSNVLFLSLVVVLGMVIFATYSNCDPVLSKRLNDSNHLMIFFASETGKHVPGLMGLCMAGIISASLSSMSTIINSISCNIFEDVVKPALPWRLNEKQTNYCIKGIALFFGLVVTFGNFALDVSGGIYQVFRTFISLAGGLIVFIFGFGIFFRKANTKGVIAGSVTGLIVTLWLGIGMQAAVSNGQIKYLTKMVTNEGCQLNSTEPLPYNITTEGFVGIVPVIFDEDLPFPYRITYNYLIGISIVVSAVIGTIVSLCTQGGEPLDESLIIPLLRKNRPNINRDYTQHAEEVRNRNNVEMRELTRRE
ncbi:sodium-coupled monocarboxylate transporter 1-like [Rhodnius prolixus]